MPIKKVMVDCRDGWLLRRCNQIGYIESNQWITTFTHKNGAVKLRLCRDLQGLIMKIGIDLDPMKIHLIQLSQEFITLLPFVQKDVEYLLEHNIISQLPETCKLAIAEEIKFIQAEVVTEYNRVLHSKYRGTLFTTTGFDKPCNINKAVYKPEGP